MTDPAMKQARMAMRNMATVLALEVFKGYEDAVPRAETVTAALVDLIDARIQAAMGASQ